MNAEEVEKPSRVRLRFTNEDKGEEEWPGRVIECQFGDDEDANRLVVLSTYSPNNGAERNRENEGGGGMILF